MSSGKAPANQQKAPNTNRNPNNPNSNQNSNNQAPAQAPAPQHQPPKMAWNKVASNNRNAPGRTGSGPSAQQGPQRTNTTINPAAAPFQSNAAGSSMTSRPSSSAPKGPQGNATSQSSSTQIPFRPGQQSANPTSSSSTPPVTGFSSTNVQSNTTQSGQAVSSVQEEYAVSPGQGTAGSDSFAIRVNRFQIQDDHKIPASLFVYSVQFPKIGANRDRTVKNGNVKKIMINQMLEQAPLRAQARQYQIFTDWDNLIITKTRLENLPASPTVTHPAHGVIRVNFDFPNQAGTTENFDADISFNCELKKSDFKAYVDGRKPADFNLSMYTRAFNILIRSRAVSNNNNWRAGRNRIFPDGNDTKTLPSSRLEACIGFYNSFRPANKMWQLHLNTSAAAFYPEGPLIDYLIGRFGNNFYNNYNRHQDEVERAISNLQVRYMYTPPDALSNGQSRSTILTDPVNQGGRLKRINGFGDPATSQKFKISDTERPTVQNHFNQNVLSQHDQLQYPMLPVINVGAAKEGPKTWVPIELLYIEPGQALTTTVPSSDMDVMGPFSRRNPAQNVQLIEGQRPGQGMHTMEVNALSQRGVITIDTHMLEVDGRQLHMPWFQYSDGKAVPVNNGRWKLVTDVEKDKNGKPVSKAEKRKFVHGMALKHFAVIQIGSERDFDLPAAKKIASNVSEYGVTNDAFVKFAHSDTANVQDLNTAYNKLLKKTGQQAPSVILINLETQDIDTYAQVKTWGDTVKGVNTVCLTDKKLRDYKVGPGLWANLALKFNVKLQGKNHVLQEESYKLLHRGNNGGTMVVGADVTHPGSGSTPFCPSIAAVVASTDRDCVYYPGSMRLQRGKTERIIDMRRMMKERLTAWKTKNGEPPSRILVYRDGVGEDQYAMIKNHELADIRAACKDIRGDYDPAITVIVCTKRHQTRFYPVKDAMRANTDYSNKIGQFSPGLVVDDEKVRLPGSFDFFLQSQQPLEGTGRPCHYFVLENGIGYNADEIQQVTYALSWVYQTSVTPISIAAPAYYADKLCDRGRCYIRELLVRKSNIRDLRNILPQNYDWDNSSEDQIRDDVARELTVGNHEGLWPNRDNTNPCHKDVTDTMFYV